MQNLKRDTKKENQNEKALKEHTRLAELFKNDRLAFERERKRLIDEAINSAESEKNSEQMRAFQDSWDKKMKSAGSAHNRLILAQHLFWEHMKKLWQPLQ